MSLTAYSNKQAQFSSPRIEDAYNAVVSMIVDDGWDLDSATDQLYTAYGLDSNGVQEVTEALYKNADIGDALQDM